MLKIVTLNLLNDLRYWDERSPLILAVLRRLSPDVIALQEVSAPHNNAAWLAHQLQGYTILLAPKNRHHARIEGLAILTRLPVEEHSILPLAGQSRIAQRAILRLGSIRWIVINTHLFWSPFDDPVRIRQAQRLVDWVPNELPAVICGDFNALPHYRAIHLLKKRFRSAYQVVHGREPDYTFPTLLKRGPGMRHMARNTTLRLIGKAASSAGPTWRATLDFIFISQGVRVMDCRVEFDQPSQDDPQIYPSDHLGLFAMLDYIISPGREIPEYLLPPHP
jgi:endonuclease/exonuclease/phosphatase family metal-dependent hydrolase